MDGIAPWKGSGHLGRTYKGPVREKIPQLDLMLNWGLISSKMGNV